MIVFYRDRFHSGPLPIPADSPWLRHGVGVFETLIWTRSRLAWLDRHLARAAAGLDGLGLGPLPENLDVLLADVVGRNRLADDTARVTLHLGPEHEDGPVVPMVTAASYTRPPPEPVTLTVAEGVHLSHLARFKTISYLPFRDATRRARAAGAWDAVLLDFEGHLLETGTGALVFEDDEGLVTPETPWKLPSVALAAVADARSVRQAPIRIDDLAAFRHAWLLNSLVGALPVGRLGEQDFASDVESARALRGLIWQHDDGGTP